MDESHMAMQDKMIDLYNILLKNNMMSDAIIMSSINILKIKQTELDEVIYIAHDTAKSLYKIIKLLNINYEEN